MGVKTLTYVLLGRDELSKVTQKAGKNVESHGKMISTAMTGAAIAISASLIPALKNSITDAEHSNKVADQTAAVLKSTGNAAHVTSAAIGNLSSSIMKKTGIDDEAIRTGANMLLTFTNIRNEAGKGNDIFNQTTGAVTDMAAAMNGGNVTEENMRSTSVLVGKALNDPLKGLTALSRVGVSFTAQQKEQIKAMVASGDKMGAQKLILGELRKEFKGSAEAAATPFKKLKTTMGELSETIGTVVLPIALRLADWAQSAVAKFSALPKPIQTLVVTLAGVAAIGVPIILTMAKITQAVKVFGIASKLAALGNPWVLLAATIAIIAVLIITHWTTIKNFIVKVMGIVLGAVKAVWDWIKKNWPLLLAILTGPFGLAVIFIVKHWDTIVNACKIALNTIKGLATTAWNAVGNAFKWAWEHILKPAINTLWTVFSTVFGQIIHGAATAFGWIPGIGGKLKEASRKFDSFKNDVNKALGNINNKNVNIGVAMTAATSGKGIIGKVARGGPIVGPGGPTADMAGLFALSNDEYVVRASAHRKYGTKFLNAINTGRLAAGGPASGININVSTPSASSIQGNLTARVLAVVKKNWQNVLAPVMSGGVGGSGVQRWAGMVLTILAMYGQPASLLQTVLRRMNQESGGNPRAINLWDSNARAGTPSMGLMQTIMPTFLSYAGPYASRGPYDPFANIYASFGYAMSRYGSLAAAFNRAGGYANGTRSARRGFAWVGERGRELMGFGGGESVTPGNRVGGVVYNINVTAGPLARPSDVGREVVGAIKEFERGAGTGWRS